MEKILALLQRITPEIIDLLRGRYTILRKIFLHQPIGRRTLAQMLAMSERVLRGEVDELKDLGLVAINPLGITLTSDGEDMLEQVASLIHSMVGLTDLERSLAAKLGVAAVHIVDGDSDLDPQVKYTLGRRTAELIIDILPDVHVIAVAGGSTLAQVAEAMPQHHSHQSVTIVPARGGLGEEVELQASTVAAQLARRLNGSYRMLHVPDNLSPEAMQSLINESSVAEVLKIVHSADLVVHGIGAAAEMAERRGTRPAETASILKAGAMGEAFGFYFDAQGHIVYNMPSVGLGLNELNQIQQRIAVAGGKQKAAAICAVLKGCGGHVLVTDEGAARAMEEILR